jgi:CRP-like cAMP-binding protein
MLPLAQRVHIMAQSIRHNLQLFLDRLNCRSILNEEEQRAVLNLPAYAQQVQGNRDFVPLGKRVDHASLVVAGVVGRFDQTREGKRQITALHLPGDMCDLYSVVQPIPTSALQSLSVSTILCVPHVAIRAVAGRYPALAEAFWRDCMVDAAIMSEWLLNVGSREAKKRVAHLLCEMASRLRATANPDDVVFDLPLTQDQLADATGLTGVHMNRTIQSLRGDGLVEWRSRVARLPRWDAMVALADFDPTYLQLNIRPEHRMRIVQAS